MSPPPPAQSRLGGLLAVAAFHLVVTPIARLARALRIDLLHLRLDPRRETYFTEHR